MDTHTESSNTGQKHIKFIITQKLLPLLKKANHPQIINISSAANYARLPTESAYTAVKAGLSALSEVLQKELQKHNIRVSTIHPWTVNTHNLENPQNYLKPEDISKLILYIISTNPNCNILNVELSAVSDWRGGWPPWCP